MSIIFFGTPRFAVPSLDALLKAGEDVRAVVTRPDKRRGRGAALMPSPVKELALKKGLAVLEPKSMKDRSFIDTLNEIAPEFIVVVAYGRILSNEVLDAPSIAPVNLHASLLPKYRGASPMAWAIINGEKVTGITTMIITERLDEGDILLQEKHEIHDEDTTESLGARLSVAGGPLLVRTLSGMRDGSVSPLPQTGETNYAPLLTKEDGRVDWSRPARELFNFVRGMHPWPGAFCFLDELRVKLIKVSHEEGRRQPGEIHDVGRDSFSVGCGEGILKVLEIQPEGKRRMSARDFLAGRRIAEGEILK